MKDFKSFGRAGEESLSALADSLFCLREELAYELQHLGAENFSEAGLESLRQKLFNGTGGEGE